MKLRIELNEKETNAIGRLYEKMHDEKLEKGKKEISDKTGKVVFDVSNTAILEMNSNSQYVIDTIDLVADSVSTLIPFISIIKNKFLSWKDKWVESDNEVLYRKGFLYKLHLRGQEHPIISESEERLYETLSHIKPINILYIYETETGKDITEEVISKVIEDDNKSTILSCIL